LQGETMATASTETEDFSLIDFSAIDRKVLSLARVKQNFFRRAVLSNYRGRCCMSAVSDPRLLIASHIVPWSKDRTNRLNPSNGLCLSAIHDKAFDRGLISLTDDYRVIVSAELKRSTDVFVQDVLVKLEGHPIEMPERFRPTQEFIASHRAMFF
jgi:predicted restriction endonuclease